MTTIGANLQIDRQSISPSGLQAVVDRDSKLIFVNRQGDFVQLDLNTRQRQVLLEWDGNAIVGLAWKQSGELFFATAKEIYTVAPNGPQLIHNFSDKVAALAATEKDELVVALQYKGVGLLTGSGWQSLQENHFLFGLGPQQLKEVFLAVADRPQFQELRHKFPLYEALFDNFKDLVVQFFYQQPKFQSLFVEGERIFYDSANGVATTDTTAAASQDLFSAAKSLANSCGEYPADRSYLYALTQSQLTYDQTGGLIFDGVFDQRTKQKRLSRIEPDTGTIRPIWGCQTADKMAYDTDFFFALYQGQVKGDLVTGLAHHKGATYFSSMQDQKIYRVKAGTKATVAMGEAEGFLQSPADLVSYDGRLFVLDQFSRQIFVRIEEVDTWRLQLDLKPHLAMSDIPLSFDVETAGVDVLVKNTASGATRVIRFPAQESQPISLLEAELDEPLTNIVKFQSRGDGGLVVIADKRVLELTMTPTGMEIVELLGGARANRQDCGTGLVKATGGATATVDLKAALDSFCSGQPYNLAYDGSECETNPSGGAVSDRRCPEFWSLQPFSGNQTSL